MNKSIMKIIITNDEHLRANWMVLNNMSFEVIREEKRGDESNRGYWIKTPGNDEVKILKSECRILKE